MLTFIRADQLEVGDIVDLESDLYADPHHTHRMFASELALVTEIEIETPNCVAIGIEGADLFGFPRDHLIKHWKERSHE